VTSATVPARPEPGNAFAKGRRAFRNWRRSRPFWGGLLVALASLPIMYFPYNDLSVGALRIHMATTAGAGAAVIGLLLLALGISVWFQPLIRIFAGIAAIVLALVSLPVSNFGGFGLGLFPGLIGGALVASWAPNKEETEGHAAAAEDGDPSDDDEEEVKLNQLMAEEDVRPAGEPARPAEEETTSE
jgi:hypothetical protein